MPATPSPQPRAVLFGRALVQVVSLPCALMLVAYWATIGMAQPPYLVIALSIVLHLLFWPAAVGLALGWVVRSRVGVAASALSLTLLAAAYAPYFLPASGPAPAGARLRVMTFNTFISQVQPGPVIEQIETYAPDIVAIQEFFPRKRDGVLAALAQTYPYHDTGNPYGLLSRYPLENCQFIPLVPVITISGWVQRCDVRLEGRRLTVFNTHLRPPGVMLPAYANGAWWAIGADPRRRDGDLRALEQAIGDHPGPYLVLGDFNLGDMEPAHRRLPPNWVDAFAEAGWGLGLTYQRPGLPFPTWRIDYVFHTPELAATAAFPGYFNGSDHRPVIADLGFKR